MRAKRILCLIEKESQLVHSNHRVNLHRQTTHTPVKRLRLQGKQPPVQSDGGKQTQAQVCSVLDSEIFNMLATSGCQTCWTLSRWSLIGGLWEADVGWTTGDGRRMLGTGLLVRVLVGDVCWWVSSEWVAVGTCWALGGDVSGKQQTINHDVTCSMVFKPT